MPIAHFEEIAAWKEARVLVTDVYAFATAGPGRLDFSYRSQVCRAVISVMTNIAEGFSRRSRAEFARFLDISRASAREVQSLLYIALDLGYITRTLFTAVYRRASHTIWLITRLMRSIQ